jgi:hypothetical protein
VAFENRLARRGQGSGGYILWPPAQRNGNEPGRGWHKPARSALAGRNGAAGAANRRRSVADGDYIRSNWGFETTSKVVGSAGSFVPDS